LKNLDFYFLFPFQYFQIACTKPEGKPVDAHVMPYALYEIAILHSTQPAVSGV